MYDSPLSLQNCVTDFICENIQAFYDDQENEFDPLTKLILKEGEVYLHANVSEQLLETLSLKGKLTDATISLFDSAVTNLRRVKLQNASSLTKHGLKVLKSHRIISLEATNLKITISSLLSCLGEWTVQNLQYLNVSNCGLGDDTKYTNIDLLLELCQLKNLRVLNISHTDLNKHMLDIIVEDLRYLEYLDISSTPVHDVSPLRRCKDKLRYLSLYNLRNLRGEVHHILLELENLEYLDISTDKDFTDPIHVFLSVPPRMCQLLQHSGALPRLKYLDISGRDDANLADLQQFVTHHHNLSFLGLMHSELCYDFVYGRGLPSNLAVAGSATEQQVLEALKRYKQRPPFVQKSLYDLFRYTQAFGEPRIDVLKLVLANMRLHPKQFAIQMAATACLYNLTKGELGQKIHPSILKEVVHLTLVAMENFPKTLQLQKNTLLTLCSDRILQDVPFDRYKCARLVMDCLCEFDDPSMGRMSAAICSILAAKISTVETSLLGSNPMYMRKLLSIVKAKTDLGIVDITIKFTLSALWNLTDESPTTCEVFLEENGMKLFLDVLEAFEDEPTVETKILGLMNNIAEVGYLRPRLMVDQFVAVLRKLLHSKLIDVSYFAAGIIAHLASSGPGAWILTTVNRQSILSELKEVILSWNTPESEMVAYRSFLPFFHLLLCQEAPEVQLWALWAIQHVCSKNPKRYCPMLCREQVDGCLRHLVDSGSSPTFITDLCINVLEILSREGFQRYYL